jgi:protein-tyrosine kinase
VAAWSEPEAPIAPPAVAAWSEPETVIAPPAVAAWSEPEAPIATPVATWSEPATMIAPPAVAASSEPEITTAPLPTWDFDGSVASAGLVERRDEPEPVVPSDWKTYRFGAVASRKTIVDPDVESSLVEQYRRLAASLHHAQLQRNVRTVMITSAVAAEGKTLTATNLALTLSHSYKRRVLLIDADLRRPTVHEAFRIANDTGLGDVLRNGETRQLPLHRASETLWILTAGRPTSDPMSALASDEMRTLLAEAIEHFDWVIVDSPPVALLSDANLVAAMVDTTILVIGSASTPYPLVRRAVESVGASRIMGTVLNRIERGQMVGGYGYYDYYGYGSGKDDTARKTERADTARKAAMDAA